MRRSWYVNSFRIAVTVDFPHKRPTMQSFDDFIWSQHEPARDCTAKLPVILYVMTLRPGYFYVQPITRHRDLLSLTETRLLLLYRQQLKKAFDPCRFGGIYLCIINPNRMNHTGLVRIRSAGVRLLISAHNISRPDLKTCKTTLWMHFILWKNLTIMSLKSVL